MCVRVCVCVCACVCVCVCVCVRVGGWVGACVRARALINESSIVIDYFQPTVLQN